jgi:hypothetical protein
MMDMLKARDGFAKHSWLLTVVALVGGLWLFLPAAAEARQRAGVRAGISGDPDQFVIGGHLETGPLLDSLVFRPNVEMGVGDDLFLVGFNFELAYKIPIQPRPWSVYFGAGPALNILSFDNERRGRDGTSAEAGFNLLLGLEHDGGLFAELKVGGADSPELKFTVGYSF